MSHWLMRGNDGRWHFTKNKPLVGEPYYTFFVPRHPRYPFMESREVGSIDTARADRQHANFRPIRITCVVT